MSKERYVELVTKFCKLVNLDQPENILAGNAVEIDGVDFYLSHKEETDPEVLIIYCDFGSPKKDRLLDVYRALLEANMTIYGSNSPAFMLSPTGNVALAYHYHLEQVAPEQLLGLFTTLTEQAKEWNKHYFL